MELSTLPKLMTIFSGSVMAFILISLLHETVRHNSQFLRIPKPLDISKTLATETSTKSDSERNSIPVQNWRQWPDQVGPYTIDVFPYCQGNFDDVESLVRPQARDAIKNCSKQTYFQFGDNGLAYKAQDDSGIPGNKTCPRKPIFSAIPLPSIFLASWPGSGNTWTRFIIQQLTGIWTGSVYRNKGLYKDGFLGEYKPLNSSEVIVVKTHYFVEENWRNTVPTKQILVVRNPYDAAAAEFKRGILKANHRGHVDINPNSTEWQNYSQTIIKAWSSFMKRTLSISQPQLIVMYEDLKTCLKRELLRIAQFLKCTGVSKFSICCALQNNEGTSHRKQGRVPILSLYSNTTRQRINDEIESVAQWLAPRLPNLAQRLMDYRMFNDTDT